jgi:tetratricopeptide (TPR) repeat protein
MKPVRKGHVLALLALLAFALLSTGCDQIDARRQIKEANKLYKDGKFEEAAPLFESALTLEPGLAIAHHNAGLTYFKMFKAGVETPENKAVAAKATDHLGKYLDTNPNDLHIRDMITRVWVDSGDYPKALAYWQKEHDADPKNRDVIEKLAGINFKAGNWEEAASWYQKEADVSPDDAGRIAAYLNIAKLGWNKLSNREKTLGAERIRVADLSLAALQKAEALDSQSMEIEGYIASVYEFRSLAHGVSWAAAIDRASTQAHRAKWRVLKEAADKAAKQQNPTAPAPAAPAPAGG